MKTTKKSRAEIQRAYRQRLLERNAEEARAKECKRWHARRSLKKVKVVEYMSEREKMTTRWQWRVKKAAYRAQLKRSKADTPPSSEEGSSTERVKRERPKVAYKNTKAYRRVAAVTSQLKSTKTSMEKYKKTLVPSETDSEMYFQF